MQPYLAEEQEPLDAMKTAAEPFKRFMLAQTREADLDMFVRISEHEPVERSGSCRFLRTGSCVHDQ